MQTINLQINLAQATPVVEKPKLSYQLGYELGEVFKRYKTKKIAVKVEKILDIKHNNDYSIYEFPTVFRKERNQ
jgi:hypothetical protein